MSDTSAPPAPKRWTLRDLPFAARLTLAVTLLSIGIGYVSAIVNLHFQEATPGEILPTPDDVEHAYHGKSKTTQWERLLTAHPNLPFNGQGSMRAAFLKEKLGGAYTRAVRNMKEKFKADDKDAKVPADLDKAVRQEFDGERLALIEWSKLAAADRAKTYTADDMPRTPELLGKPITPDMLNDKADEKDPEDTRTVKVRTIIKERCARCHGEGKSVGQYPLDTLESVMQYTAPEAPAGKSLSKLALSTHVHLLGFSLLYGLTGVLFALSSWPAFLRIPIAPLALVAQVVDISFWWLARLPEPDGAMYAKLIPVTGGIVALALLLQIVLTVFSLFGWLGRFVLVLAFAGAGYGAYVAKEKVVDPYLKHEKESMVVKG